MSLTNTKSLLAKLLASENLTVEHGNYETASMDVKNRILRLPIWKEMSGSLYDLMVLHEVGHALYTPEDGWHESASDKGRGYKSFLNVVEDARIERKIKDKYPGGRRSFTDGYLDLIKKDFFGIKDIDVNELNLIDRINLHFKGGTLHDIEFSDEEMEFVEKVSKTMTWDDVVRVTDELYEYAKDHESDTDMSDHSSMSMEFGEDEEDDSDSEMESMEGEDSSSDDFDNFMDELKKRGLEAGEEEKEESGGMTAENEGENEGPEEEGNSSGSGSEKSDEESNDSTSASGSDSDEEGKDEGGSFGGGAGRGKPDFDSIGRTDTLDPKSFTDENFRSRENELVQNNLDYSIEYGNLPIADTSKIIIDYKEIQSLIRNHYSKRDEDVSKSGNYSEEDLQLKKATEKFIEFRSVNKKTVEYLAKEFEMKKAADAHSRTLTANSGIIDTSLLHTYKYNEHIFKKINVTADGKNHGLVMVVDWSGSMGNNIKGTIEQMMVLVMFAKRVNIPFEVFLFSDSYPSEMRKNEGRGYASWAHKDGGKNGDLIISAHHLLNVFSSRMRANELHEAYINMTAIAQAYDRDNYYGYRYGYRTYPGELSLGGTPLNDSLLAMNTFIPEFKSKNGVQIVNLIYLTDGDSSGGCHVWERVTRMEKNYDGEMVERAYETKNIGNRYSYSKGSQKTIIRDTVTKKDYEMDDRNGYYTYSRNSMTNTLVEILRDKHGVNVVNFYVIPNFKRRDAVDFIPPDSEITADKIVANWRKEGHIIAKNYGGWSELYLIRGGKSLGVEESVFEVKEDAKKGEIKRAFSKLNKGKLKNRLLLSKFVDMVAA